MKILIGPEVCFAGSHFSITDIPDTPRFHYGQDFLDAVKEHNPDIVFLRSVGQNNVTPEMIAKCPVPVIGFAHDWICWGSERLEAACQQVDWLITEKTAYQYLQSQGHHNCSPFLLMSHMGVENVMSAGLLVPKVQNIDVTFLGAIVVDGYKDLSRWREDDNYQFWNNVYWSRLGFRGRSQLLSQTLSRDDITTFVAAQTPQKVTSYGAKAVNSSYEILRDSAINIHLCHGRKYAANRCFETMALGTLLLCEQGNEIFDFIPEGLVGKYSQDTLQETIDYYLANPELRKDMAFKAQQYAIEHLKNDKLQEKLLNLIDENMVNIVDNYNNRHHDPRSLHRAPVHHEVKWAKQYEQFELDVLSQGDSAIGQNEIGWFKFDKWTKFSNDWDVEQKSEILKQAKDSFAKAIELDAGNIIPYWNKAVTCVELGQFDDAIDMLKSAKELLETSSQVIQYKGSRLETKQSWWFSGHIEPAMGFAKINKSAHDCEMLGMLYRIDMMLHFIDETNTIIHWPDLPDEHAKVGDWERVKMLDPFWLDNNPSKEKIYDVGLSKGREKFKLNDAPVDPEICLVEKTHEYVRAVNSQDDQRLKSLLHKDFYQNYESHELCNIIENYRNKFVDSFCFKGERYIGRNSKVIFYNKMIFDRFIHEGKQTVTWKDGKIISIDIEYVEVDDQNFNAVLSSSELKFYDNVVMAQKLNDPSMKVVGWGVGNYYQIMKEGYLGKLDYLVDGSDAKHGTQIDGIDIFSPQHLLKEDKSKLLVVVFSTLFAEIQNEMEKLGILYYMAPIKKEMEQSALKLLEQSSSEMAPVERRHSKRVAIVIQGPVVKGITKSLVKAFHRTHKDAILILSTWADTPKGLLDEIADDLDSIILNDDVTKPGHKNRNRQSFTAHEGVKKALELNCEFVLKIRSDLWVSREDLLDYLFGLWIKYPAKDSLSIKGRLIVPSTFSRLIMPLHPSDFFMFGHIDDVLAYWSGPHEMDGDQCNSDASLWDVTFLNAIPESSYAVEYFKKVNSQLPKDYKMALNSFCDHFIVVDDEDLDLVWSKLLFPISESVGLSQLYSHALWRAIALEGKAHIIAEMFNPKDIKVIDFRGCSSSDVVGPI